MPVTIKRYQNRKLYNTQSKRYITLEGIEDLLKNGQEIIVIDNSTGKDITAITLSQIIFEFEKNRSGFLPIKLLVSLVQSGGNRIDDLRRNITDSLGLYHLYDVEIERRLKLLIERGELTQDAATQLLKKLISINHQAYDSKRILKFLFRKLMHYLKIWMSYKQIKKKMSKLGVKSYHGVAF